MLRRYHDVLDEGRELTMTYARGKVQLMVWSDGDPRVHTEFVVDAQEILSWVQEMADGRHRDPINEDPCLRQRRIVLPTGEQNMGMEEIK